jgi:hypothetical protein
MRNASTQRLTCLDAQEEPLNNGAWTYVGPRILTAANATQHHTGKYPFYAGRGPTGSVATGSKARLLLDNMPRSAENNFFFADATQEGNGDPAAHCLRLGLVVINTDPSHHHSLS